MLDSGHDGDCRKEQDAHRSWLASTHPAEAHCVEVQQPAVSAGLGLVALFAEQPIPQFPSQTGCWMQAPEAHSRSQAVPP